MDEKNVTTGGDRFYNEYEMEKESQKVDVTEQYIRIRQKDPGKYHTHRTIDIDAKRGIKAVIGITGTGKERRSEVQSFLFSRDPKHRWTAESARHWINEHKSAELDTAEQKGINPAIKSIRWKFD